VLTHPTRPHRLLVLKAGHRYDRPMTSDAQEIRNGVAISAIQSRMARAAIGWGVRDLATAAQVATDTIARLERGETIKLRTIAAIRAALEAAGVEFIPENGGGAGVRLRKF
jgi:DNA-binding Xre family transcriptional regulator